MVLIWSDRVNLCDLWVFVVVVFVVVRGFEIVAGARRFRAAQIAEVSTIPACIVNLSDAEALEAQLVELSIVGKSFLCLHAARYVVYM